MANPFPIGVISLDRESSPEDRHLLALNALKSPQHAAIFAPDPLAVDHISDEVRARLERLLEEDRPFLDLLLLGARYSAWLRQFSAEFADLASFFTPVAMSSARRRAKLLGEVESFQVGSK